jgi:hypothetical protein
LVTSVSAALALRVVETGSTSASRSHARTAASEAHPRASRGHDARSSEQRLEVQGLGRSVWNLGLWGLGSCGPWVWGSGFTLSGFKVWGLEFKVKI